MHQRMTGDGGDEYLRRIQGGPFRPYAASVPCWIPGEAESIGTRERGLLGSVHQGDGEAGVLLGDNSLVCSQPPAERYFDLVDPPHADSRSILPPCVAPGPTPGSSAICSLAARSLSPGLVPYCSWRCLSEECLCTSGTHRWPSAPAATSQFRCMLLLRRADVPALACLLSSSICDRFSWSIDLHTRKTGAYFYGNDRIPFCLL